LVSIIIPTFNRAHLIGETLDSVLTQTYTNWECIVVDDGSTDEIARVMQTYVGMDTRIQYYPRPIELPKGGNVCRNFGFMLSKGDFIQWLDSDDLLDNNKLKSQLSAFEHDDNLCITTCKFGYFSDGQNKTVRDRVLTYKDFNTGLALLEAYGMHAEYFPIHVFLTKRTILETVGLWNERMVINQDSEFFTRVLLASGYVKFVDTVVFYRKSNSGNVSLVTTSLKAEKLIESWTLIQKHIAKKTNNKKHVYVEMAKRIVYNKLIKDYPDVVKNNSSFFRSIQPFYKRFLKIY
jgi:glycosyltransferase involved in cell wall biosynthesis